MYKDFYIHKKSGTYSETLEAFGVAILVNEILTRLDIGGRKIIIEDKGLYYLVSSNKEITKEALDAIDYFQVVKFLINKPNTSVPDEILHSDCFDYPVQKERQDRYKEEFQKIANSKDLSKEQRKEARTKLNDQKRSEFGNKIDAEYDVYRELIKNPYASYTKLYNNFYENQNHFSELIKEIFDHYAQLPVNERDYKLIDEKPNAQSIVNPSQGKGLNGNKATGARYSQLKNIASSWIVETMKVSGALRMMSIQYVKIGSSKYDLKIYVPEFKKIQLSKGVKLLMEFKRYLKSVSPIKLDILNILDLIIQFIKLTPEYQRGKIKNTIGGFHSVVQKKLGGPSKPGTVTNIGFINTPNFIEYTTKEKGKEWIYILQEQKNIITGIEERGDAIQGLQDYRNFLGSTGSTAFTYFSYFSYWYAAYLTQSLDKERYYVKPFKTEILTKFYENMNTPELNISSIIQNEGFQAVAGAIRYSTVKIQYNKEYWEKQVGFKVRYGLAQELQNKSKSKESLATFIGEFVGTYNAETARNNEKKDGRPSRANVKDEELAQFYAILDKNPARLVGALLASYGFALTKKGAPQAESDDLPDENVI